jgi:acyl dehydratase
MFVVHGEQDMHFHQPLVPGRSITSVSQPFSVRVGGSGTRYTVTVASSATATGEPVLTQFFTLFIRGMVDGESGGPDKPAHDFPEEARSRAVGEHAVHVDDDQTYRYRDASGDLMPIHVDDELARSVGLPGIIAHGLCTMAMSCWGVLGEVGGSDAKRLKRFAVRFAKMVIPGDDLETRIWKAGAHNGVTSYAFETARGEDFVITDGLAEIVDGS